jgi:hypothetical protein
MADAKEAMVETSGDTDFGDGWLNTHVADIEEKKTTPSTAAAAATTAPSTTTSTPTHPVATTAVPAKATAAPATVAAPAKAPAKAAAASNDDDAPDLDAVLDDNFVEPVRDEQNDMEALVIRDHINLLFHPPFGLTK